MFQEASQQPAWLLTCTLNYSHMTSYTSFKQCDIEGILMFTNTIIVRDFVEDFILKRVEVCLD